MQISGHIGNRYLPKFDIAISVSIKITITIRYSNIEPDIYKGKSGKCQNFIRSPDWSPCPTDNHSDLFELYHNLKCNTIISLFENVSLN